MQSTTATTAAEPIWFLNNLAFIRMASEDTGGAYSIVEITGAPGDAPPLHVHANDDEGFYVLEGTIRVHVGDRTVVLGPGDAAVAPRGVPHVYVVEGDTPARWLATSSDGFDRFVREVGAPAAAATLPVDPELPPVEKLVATAARHGIEILGPPGALPG
jgi:quercetin dioxygenase-like cupin family protein